jgi:transposase
MPQDSAVFVGLDTSKMKISMALAEDGRHGEVRFFGDIENTPEAVRRLVTKLAGKSGRLMFCYEAGPTGYGLHRQITALGHDCAVIAPSLIPKRPGERVKTNRRDAVTLARLHRAGELTRIWVPDPGHEAVRELVRAREAAMRDLREKRQHLQSFLLRHGRVFTGRKAWTRAHARWLAELAFEHPAQHLVLREYRQAIEDAEARLSRTISRNASRSARTRSRSSTRLPGRVASGSGMRRSASAGRRSRRRLIGRPVGGASARIKQYGARPRDSGARARARSRTARRASGRGSPGAGR